MNSKEWIKSLNFRITFIKNKITDLEDEYQHYTMVDKDKVKEILLKEEIDLYKQIKQDLNRLEQLEKENAKLKKRETPSKLHGVYFNEDIFYGRCDYCGSTNRLAQHYDHKQQKWIKQGYCIHCGQKYDWSEHND